MGILDANRVGLRKYLTKTTNNKGHNMNDVMEPTCTSDDLYQGKEFQPTPPGVYRMTVHSRMSIRKTSQGDKKKLELFFLHADPDNKSVYKGVNGSVMLTGADKNGKALRRQFAQFLTAVGVVKETIFGSNGAMREEVQAVELDDLEAADWKGVPASIIIDGEPLDLEGKELNVKVVASTFNGKTTIKADAYYPVS